MTREVGFNDSKNTDEVVDPSWDSILDRGERILWQGRPDTAVSIKPKNMALTLFGCVFAGFALFWMVMASMAGGFFWMFGLIHFFIGAGVVYASIFGSSFMRKRTWYTLTNKRALIATELPIKGKGLKLYPITAETQLDFLDETPATIYFAQNIRRGKNGPITVNIGFEGIEEGRKVYGLLRRIQGGRV